MGVKHIFGPGSKLEVIFSPMGFCLLPWMKILLTSMETKFRSKRAFGQRTGGLVWFCAARNVHGFIIPFVIDPRFGNQDGPSLGGTVYQMGSGGEYMEASLASM